MENNNLSPEVKEIIELAGLDGDVTQAIQAHPDLVPGLTEYCKWRENKKLAERQDTVPAVQHSLAGAEN
jgi:hypothetical protein